MADAMFRSVSDRDVDAAHDLEDDAKTRKENAFADMLEAKEKLEVAQRNADAARAGGHSLESPQMKTTLLIVAAARSQMKTTEEAFRRETLAEMRAHADATFLRDYVNAAGESGSKAARVQRAKKRAANAQLAPTSGRDDAEWVDELVRMANHAREEGGASLQEEEEAIRAEWEQMNARMQAANAANGALPLPTGALQSARGGAAAELFF